VDLAWRRGDRAQQRHLLTSLLNGQPQRGDHHEHHDEGHGPAERTGRLQQELPPLPDPQELSVGPVRAGIGHRSRHRGGDPTRELARADAGFSDDTDRVHLVRVPRRQQRHRVREEDRRLLVQAAGRRGRQARDAVPGRHRADQHLDGIAGPYACPRGESGVQDNLTSFARGGPRRDGEGPQLGG
jgi:hypothetical protein